MYLILQKDLQKWIMSDYLFQLQFHVNAYSLQIRGILVPYSIM